MFLPCYPHLYFFTSMDNKTASPRILQTIRKSRRMNFTRNGRASIPIMEPEAHAYLPQWKYATPLPKECKLDFEAAVKTRKLPPAPPLPSFGGERSEDDNNCRQSCILPPPAYMDFCRSSNGRSKSITVATITRRKRSETTFNDSRRHTITTKRTKTKGV